MRSRQEVRGALLWAAALAVYGNLFTALAGRASDPGRSLIAVAGPLSVLGLVLFWHRQIDGLLLAAVGLHTRHWRRGLAWGAVAGAVMAGPPLLYFLLPGPTGTALQFEEVRGMALGSLLVRLLLTTPVLVALVEEVAFRGFLQGKCQRALPTRPCAALAVSSLAFALWHMAVNLRTLQQTNATSAGVLPLTLPLALAGGSLGVFAAGLVFGSLYRQTGSLVAPGLAHWLVDALMLLTLSRQPST